MVKNLLRLIMILMLVLMGSAQAMAQGLKIKRFSYAKSGDLLKGEQIYSRNRESRSLDSQQGYAPTPWILYLENGGHVSLQFPDGQIHQVVPGVYDFSYYNNGEKMYVDVRVVPYAVPYLGGLRLQGAVSDANVHIEKTVSEEDFFTYTINSDADLKTIKINPQGGYEIDGNLGIHAALIQRFPERDYEYALRLPIEQERSFASGVSVSSLKNMAVQQRLNPNDFVLQIGLDDGEGGSVFSEVYLNQARYQRKNNLPSYPRQTSSSHTEGSGKSCRCRRGAHQWSSSVECRSHPRDPGQLGGSDTASGLCL